jgi:hypothetical protein
VPHVRLLAIAVALLLLAAPAPAGEENPIHPFTVLGKHLDDAIAAFLSGQPAATAFAPWQAELEAEDADAFRAGLKTAGIASARCLFLEYRLLYVKGEEVVYRVRGALWVTPDFARLIDLEAEREEGPVPADAIPLDANADDLRPFAAAGQALDGALRGEGWKAIPFAKVEDLKAILGDIVPEEEAERDIAEARQALAAVPAELKEIAPDRALLALGDQGYVAYDAAGKVLGGLGGGFERSPAGTMTFTLDEFHPFREDEGEDEGKDEGKDEGDDEGDDETEEDGGDDE